MDKTGTNNNMQSPGTYLITQTGGYYRLQGEDGSQQMASPNRHCCHGAFDPSQQTAKYDETNLTSLKPNVKVDFGEVFQEPEGSEGFSFIWKYNKATYYWTNRIFYAFLSGVLGPILAFCWALVFAAMNFVLVFGVNPAIKLTLQLMRIVEVMCRGAVRSVLDPIFQSFGQMFTYLRGSFSLRVTGLEGAAARNGKPALPAAITPPDFPESQA